MLMPLHKPYRQQLNLRQHLKSPRKNTRGDFLFPLRSADLQPMPG
jgi:hypothetical protein